MAQEIDNLMIGCQRCEDRRLLADEAEMLEIRGL
jgi:DNA transposition AAA+ family ATPase